MYYAITVYGGTITGVHESLTPINEDAFKNSQAYKEHLVIPVSEENIENARHVAPGKYLGEYNEDWTLKPLSQRVEERIVVIPVGCVVDGEEIREMTPEERIAAGLDEPPKEPTPEELEARERQARIYELKSLLAAEDYKIIKCYEYYLAGKSAPYDIEVLHAARQAMRDEINELEAAL